MSHDPYKAAKAEIHHYNHAWRRGKEMIEGGATAGSLFGFALDSETLQPHAIMLLGEGFQAHLPQTLSFSQEGAEVCAFEEAPTELRSVRHRKGGVYTVVGNVIRNDERLVLYVSHDDRMWWIRPRSMFIDGRFSGSQETPLTLQEIFS